MSDMNSGGMLNGEDIVISGIAGSFPMALNTEQLFKNLYNKVDMVEKLDTNIIKNPELPHHSGNIRNMTRFDNYFFRFTHSQASISDPMGRQNMEQAFCAIFDAGINPETLKGSKIGVFLGASLSDAASLSFSNTTTNYNTNNFTITGTSKAMLSNRISYWIDGKGPSLTLDQSWTGSMACLELAVERIRSGECDSAIVGGCNRAMHPIVFMNMRKAGLLCLDGKTKCFDKNGDGYVRSDAISMIFIQKAKNAKRIYTQIYDVKGKYFASPDSTFVPTRRTEDIEKFLHEFYATVDVSPDEVEYVEANATGLAEADKTELEAIGNVFGKKKAIKVGSIKSNLGHTEPASGIVSLTKVCLSFQKGKIPPNIHYNEPQNHIEAIRDGKAVVVTENVKFDRRFAAVNNFSLEGGNFHVLLKGHFKPKDLSKYKSDIPRLVLVSGRLDECVSKILSILEENPIDAEQIALLNNIFKIYTPAHTCRGYTILEANEENETKCLAKGFNIYNGTTRPIWFLYTGMGSQWPTMGAQLMRLPIFAASIRRCDKVLQTRGIDIVKIITDDDKEIFDKILNSFVGITAVQIGLTDVLKSIGIVPTNIIGHSLGEIACAYADGSLTLEEAITCAYLRGLVSLETKLIKGKMAAIGLGHQEVRKICPPEIDVACENSSESTTIAGPAEDVEKFVAHLTEQNVFARTVASSNIAYHSRYIADAGPSVFAYMKDVITDPKPRSKEWLSTSYTPDKWLEEDSLYSSAQYFTHNLLNTVHFEKTAKMIPKDAIILEIAPHGLLQAIMKRSHSNCLNLSLTRRGEKDNIKLLLQTIGLLYEAGVNPDIDVLYPKVEFPVSTETPLLSHFVDWDHSTQWLEDSYAIEEKKKTVSYEFMMSIFDDDYSVFQGCVKNGYTTFPEAAILVIVWKTLAMSNGKNYTDVSVEFSNVTFFDQIIIEEEKILKLWVGIQKGENVFEVTQNNRIIASGFVKAEINAGETFENIQVTEKDYQLNKHNIYKLMSTRGYTYGGLFQSIWNTNIERTKGLMNWDNNWITFLDSLFQLNALSRNHNGVSDIKLITQLVIDVEAHKGGKKITLVNDSETNITYGAQIFYENAVTKCGGVVLKNIQFKDIPADIHTTKLVQTKELSPHIPQLKDNVSTPLNSKLNLKLIKVTEDGSNKYTWTKVSLAQDVAHIQVAYSSIYLNDHNKSKGNSVNINQYGVGFSGTNSRGEKVMGIIPDASVSCAVVPDFDFLWPVPKHWNLEEAATVPLPYIQAYYCLGIRQEIHTNSNVYVTNGDSALGQALISLCLSLDCAVFTTVSNDENKRLLLKTFPKLRDIYVACENDVIFKNIVSNATKNQMCDVVVSNESGHKRQEAMGIVGYQGTFLDLNDKDKEENQIYGMAFNRQARSYKSVCLSNMFRTENSNDFDKLRLMLIDGIRNGSVKPFTRVIYTPSEISRAFKVLSVNSMCSVLINMTDLSVLKDDHDIVTRAELSPIKSYIVVCDGTDLGIELIEHLIQKGAKRIIVHIKPKLMNGYFHVKYAQWQKNDVVEIYLSSNDLQNVSGCAALVSSAKELGDLDGIFVSLTDFTNIDTEKNNITKAVANLDITSRNYKMSYFTVLYKIQNECGEYAYSEIEKCCVSRSTIGLPSLILRYESNEENYSPQLLSKLYNALEASWQCVTVSDSNLKTNFDAEKNLLEDGMKAFFNKISKDENTASEPIITMHTQLSYEMESELYWVPDDCYVMMIPGLDGIYESLTSISERLKIKAITLQLQPDLVTSVPDIAKYLFDHVMKRIHFHSKFYVLGYSFGVNVALELAALLEKEGHIGVVFCLDSSPDVFNQQLIAYTGKITDQELQFCILEHFYNILTKESFETLGNDFQNNLEWPEKLNMFVDKVKSSVSYTHEFLKSIINAVYSRIVMAKEYTPDFKLDSQVVLMKGIPHPRSDKLSDDYGLSKYTKKPVRVFNLETDHATAPQDVRVSNIINKMLDPTLTQAFENENLCQYYFN